MIHGFILSIIISGYIFISYSQIPDQWIKLNSPVDTFLRNMIFIDSLAGWAAGEDGKIIHTTDGGINWDIQNTNVQTPIIDIFFHNENSGLALTTKNVFPFNTIILQSTTGGNEWQTMDFPDLDAFMTTTIFLDSLMGFIGGDYIAKTTDGGNTWFRVNIDSSMLSSLPVLKFKFYNENFGYACGGARDVAGVIWRTFDGGLNWSAFGIGPDEIFDLFIIDSLNAIALSGDPEGFFSTGLVKTTNGGETWTFTPLDIFGVSYALDFRTVSEAWSASGYKFFKSINRGETWVEILTPENLAIYDLQFINNCKGYAVGENGIILKFDAPPVDVKDNKEAPPKFSLYQNYPNPFNPLTTIYLEIANDSYVTLKVFDIIGQEVAVLINENLKAGVHHSEFNASGMNSGVYLYSLNAVGINSELDGTNIPDFTSTKKMILLR